MDQVFGMSVVRPVDDYKVWIGNINGNGEVSSHDIKELIHYLGLDDKARIRNGTTKLTIPFRMFDLREVGAPIIS